MLAEGFGGYILFHGDNYFLAKGLNDGG